MRPLVQQQNQTPKQATANGASSLAAGKALIQPKDAGPKQFDSARGGVFSPSERVANKAGRLPGRLSGHAGWKIGDVPINPPEPTASQEALRINTPGDVYEQEADVIADRVMRMSVPAGVGTVSHGAGTVLRRKCDCGGGCSTCQDEEKLRQSGLLQRKESGAEIKRDAGVAPAIDRKTHV